MNNSKFTRNEFICEIKGTERTKAKDRQGWIRLVMWRRRLPSGNRPSATRSMLPGSASRVLPYPSCRRMHVLRGACNFKSPSPWFVARFIRRSIVHSFPYLSRKHPKISKGVRAHSVAGLLEKRWNKFGGAESRSGAAESACVPEIHHGDERKFQLRE